MPGEIFVSPHCAIWRPGGGRHPPSMYRCCSRGDNIYRSTLGRRSNAVRFERDFGDGWTRIVDRDEVSRSLTDLLAGHPAYEIQLPALAQHPVTTASRVAGSDAADDRVTKPWRVWPESIGSETCPNVSRPCRTGTAWAGIDLATAGARQL